MAEGGRKFFVVIITVILLSGLAFLGWHFFYPKITSASYLIPGVPYNGVYNLLFKEADSSRLSSIMDILGYWGDQRFDVDSLKEKFPVSKNIYSKEIADFFTQYGYETYRMSSYEPGKELNEVKNFVNANKKTPVMVFQREVADPTVKVSGFKVIIGFSDQDQKIIVHDHYFGNNFELSYSAFEKMFNQDASIIMAFWPSGKLQGKINGPNNSTSYSAKIDPAGKFGNAMIKKQAALALASEPEKAIAQYKEFIADPSFNDFPIAFRATWQLGLASLYLNAGNVEQTIKTINESVLPLNHNISEAPKGWVVPERDQLFSPYIILSNVYLKRGDRNNAYANYQEAKTIAATANINESDWQIWFGNLEKVFAKEDQQNH